MQAGKRLSVRQFRYSALAAVALSGGLVAGLAEMRAQSVPQGEAGAVFAADGALNDTMRDGDRSAARRLLSLQFTYVDENGQLYERKAFLDALKQLAGGPATDTNVKVYGSIGMVTGRRQSAHGGAPFFLDIWAKQHGAWRILTMQDVALAPQTASGAQQDTPEAVAANHMLKALAKDYECKNPCQTLSYRVRSPAEQDVVNAFQAVETATVGRDADGYARYLADEFMHYESGGAALTKTERVAALEDKKSRGIPAYLPEIQSMRLWVYGDSAAMISTGVLPDDAEPFLRIARVWVRRNGHWQMAISVVTDVADPPKAPQ